MEKGKGKVVTIEDRIPKLKQRRKQRANRTFIIYIFIFFLLVVGVLYFQSSFSKVAKINVEGNRYVETNEVIKLSQLSDRTGFWKINVDNVAKRIEKNQEIKKVEVKRKFPNQIMISINEYERVAYLMDESVIYPILENGAFLKNMEQSVEVPADAPILLGWKNGEELQEMAAELKKVPESILSSISEVHLTPTNTNPFHITVYMNEGYEISASIRGFSEKMEAYPSIVSNLPENQKGIIDLEVGVYFKPYEKEEDGNESNG